MEPTLLNDDNLWVEKISPRLGNIQRGDIVTISVPESENSPLVKRIIALENDTIEIRDGQVYINGKVLKEDYLLENKTDMLFNSQYNNIEIPKGYVYVMGDNRQYSNDSRYIGPVKASKIIGRVILRIYPFNRLGPLKR